MEMRCHFRSVDGGSQEDRGGEKWAASHFLFLSPEPVELQPGPAVRYVWISTEPIQQFLGYIKPGHACVITCIYFIVRSYATIRDTAFSLLCPEQVCFSLINPEEAVKSDPVHASLLLLLHSANKKRKKSQRVQRRKGEGEEKKIDR